MMRSGYPPESCQWEDEYYQVTLRDLGDHNFTQSVFAPKPALVPRHPRADGLLECEFNGQAFDRSEFELVPGRWDHQNCKSCLFRIEDGHSHWQNQTGTILCDECHDYVIRTLASHSGPTTNERG
jgi:hypothetical protein